MNGNPLFVMGRCISSDEQLFAHMDAAIARGLPEIAGQSAPIAQPAIIVGSGTSIASQVETIRNQRSAGGFLLAIKDAHDWLIEKGIMPDAALAIDPQEHRWNCFLRKQETVHYLISSQCHPAMFDHLDGHRVTIWHPCITKDQKRPLGKYLVGGGSTSGLRAIVLLYIMGYRDFRLFGFDSCLSGDILRVNGTGPKPTDQIIDVMLPSGESFKCNASMALQAQQFQDLFERLPDAHFTAYGYGLIPSIIRQRAENLINLHEARAVTETLHPGASFIHCGSEDDASYRYRALIPSREMGVPINDRDAEIQIFTKPQPDELMDMARCKVRGGKVVVDFCDDRFDWMHYQEALRLADMVTCPTAEMRKRIAEFHRDAVVIADPYEYPLMGPHCDGTYLLWYGHKTNRASLDRIEQRLSAYPLRIVSNFAGAIPWSKETMLQEFKNASIVVLPASDSYKSPNRAVEAIRQGCFVVAEPHPSLEDIPGIWIGDIVEGIEWSRWNRTEANANILKAQKYVTDVFSPRIQAAAWKRVIQSLTTSDAEENVGLVGSMLT